MQENSLTPKNENFEREMNLPVGERCGNCEYFKHCVSLFECKGDNAQCDYHPSRFIPSKDVQIERLKKMIIRLEAQILDMESDARS